MMNNFQPNRAGPAPLDFERLEHLASHPDVRRELETGATLATRFDGNARHPNDYLLVAQFSFGERPLGRLRQKVEGIAHLRARSDPARS